MNMKEYVTSLSEKATSWLAAVEHVIAKQLTKSVTLSGLHHAWLRTLTQTQLGGSWWVPKIGLPQIKKLEHWNMLKPMVTWGIPMT